MQEQPVDDGASRAVERLIAWANDPRNFKSFRCPRCGGEQEIPASASLELCDACETLRLQTAAAVRLELGERSAELERCGCPLRVARTVFVEPSTWPGDPRSPGIHLASWQGDPWSVLVAGEIDAGKTLLATELFWRQLQNARRAVWSTAAEAVRCLFGNGGESKDEAWSRLANADVLLLDDLGRGHDGLLTWELIADLLSHRYDRCLATIVTTNRAVAKGRDDKRPGLQEEHPALGRRLREGLVVGWLPRWEGRKR